MGCSMEHTSRSGAGGCVLVAVVVAVVVVAVVALPRLHDALTPRWGHYEPARFSMANSARRIINDPNSRCDFFDCETSSGSTLRVCYGEDGSGFVWAVQWIWRNAKGVWREGTAFIQEKERKLGNYLRINRCSRRWGDDGL